MSTVDLHRDMCAAEDEILALANHVGKFAIQLDLLQPARQQLALERLQISGRIRLIDVSPVAYHPGVLFRIFLVTPPPNHKRGT